MRRVPTGPRSSAGSPRGLIEASVSSEGWYADVVIRRHPRVVPAASLKHGSIAQGCIGMSPCESSAGSPRGLIEATDHPGLRPASPISIASSAGSPRGLIEAALTCLAVHGVRRTRHPRVVPAASLKQSA